MLWKAKAQRARIGSHGTTERREKVELERIGRGDWERGFSKGAVPLLLLHRPKNSADQHAEAAVDIKHGRGLPV